MPLLTTQSAKSYGLNRYLSSNSYEAIGTAMGTGSSGTVTFSSIPQTYKHLQLRTFTNTSRVGGASGSGQIWFNGDTTQTNYYTHYMYANGYTGSIGADANNANYGTFFYGDTTTLVGSVIDILDYTSTSKKTTAKIFTGYDTNADGRVGFLSLFWNNTAAVNQIDLKADSYNWGTNSRFALYGIKG